MQTLKQKNAGSMLLLALASLLLGACATGPKTFSNEGPGGNFGAYQSYNFAERLGTDDDPEVRSLLSQFLISEISSQMNSRGYRFAEGDTDITIALGLVTQEKIRSTGSTGFGGYYGRGYPFGFPYYGGYGGYGGYDTGNRIVQYTEGTLSVAIVDNSTRAIVWEGISINRINDDVRDNLGATVKTAISEMFARYPYVAGSAAQRTLVGEAR